MGGREGGGLDIFFCVYSRGFLLFHSPVDPATGWGVHIKVKKKIVELYRDPIAGVTVMRNCQ